MKKFFKRLFVVVLCVAIGYVGFRYGPNLYARLFGSGTVRWVSEKFSETLLEKNELVVSQAEVTGQETVTQDAWLLGTVQKVVMPYTFQLSYTVDLSQAKVSAEGTTVTVRVPPPNAAYHKLIVDDAKMRKTDFFYPLTPERYAEIKSQVEMRLYGEYSQNADYLGKAWDATVADLQSLFQTVVDLGRNETGDERVTIDVAVVMDATLAPAATEPPVEQAPAQTPENAH